MVRMVTKMSGHISFELYPISYDDHGEYACILQSGQHLRSEAENQAFFYAFRRRSSVYSLS